MTKSISKRDQIKTNIMALFNKKVKLVTRADIDKSVVDLGSTRTVSRALAELKIQGLISLQKNGKTTSWISIEHKTTEKVGKTKEDHDAEIDADSERKLKNKKNRKTTFTPERDKNLISNKPGVFVFMISDSDVMACSFCLHPISVKNAKICPLCHTKIDTTNKRLILQSAFNKLAGLPPVKIHDLSKLKKSFLAEVVAQILAKQKKKSTAKNIADIYEMLETTDFLDRLKKDTKKITKENLVSIGKINRNVSSAGDTKGEPDSKKAPKLAGKKVGVIATIIKAITTEYRTKKQILAQLTKAFPEREAAKMMKTINVQVPSRLRKDKNLKIDKTDKGYKIIK